MYKPIAVCHVAVQDRQADDAYIVYEFPIAAVTSYHKAFLA